MKIIKLIAYAIGISVTVTASAAILDTVTEYKKQNSSAAVMANSGGDGLEALASTFGSLSDLIKGCTDLTPESIGKPLNAALTGIHEGAVGLTQLVMRIICRS